MVIHFNKYVKLPEGIYSYEVKNNTVTGRHECKFFDMRETNMGGGLLLRRQSMNTATNPT